MTIVIPETLMWVLIVLMACNAVLGSIQIWLRYKLMNIKEQKA